MNSNFGINKKLILNAEIKPYDLKLALVFFSEQKIWHIQEYIDSTMKNFRVKFKVGRVENKKTNSILLPDLKIGDVLENKDDIIIYSIEYGLTKKKLDSKINFDDIDKCFINKKTKRDIKENNNNSFSKSLSSRIQYIKEESDVSDDENVNGKKNKKIEKKTSIAIEESNEEKNNENKGRKRSKESDNSKKDNKGKKKISNEDNDDKNNKNNEGKNSKNDSKNEDNNSNTKKNSNDNEDEEVQSGDDHSQDLEL